MTHFIIRETSDSDVASQILAVRFRAHCPTVARCSEVWGGVVEAVHGDLVAEEAAGVGGEGPQEDGDGALGEGARALLAHHVLEDVAHAVVRALRR